jgi:hypothetical protein
MNAQPNAQRPRIPMLRRAAVGTAAVAMIAPLGIVYTATPAGAVATPPETGCSAGFQTLSVSWLESRGPYQLPARLDDPANGGNGDGLVCGKPINPTRTAKLCGTPCDVPVLYEFGDNNLTPWH